MILELKDLFSKAGSTGYRQYFAPGRVNLIGEHIDYNGGLVMPIAINQGIKGIFKENPESLIQLKSTTHSNLTLFTAETIPGAYSSEIGWCNYPAGVIQGLQNDGLKLDGFNLFFDSDLPEGSGLSSSAAIEVLTTFILLTEYGGKIDLPEIAVLCQKVENEFIGVKCGIMDQFAVANCKKDHALLLNCNTLQHEHIPFELDDYALLVINSKKPRSLIKSAYNERKAESDEALRVLKSNGVLAEGQYLVDATMEAVAGISDDVIRRRARHVVSENLRVKHAANALRMGDLHTFGRLMTASHTSMKEDYEVTGLEMDTLAETAQNIDGCLGARMTGGGFGGCAIALVRKHAIQSFTDILSRRYEMVTGLQCEIYVSQACDGVRAM
ncbi:MAG: galactokinase [Bacteroidetes bacterium]|nr:galactokinase [Bacteroidota bacterium]